MTVIAANAGIQMSKMLMDPGYRIESGTSLAGVAEIGAFYDFVKMVLIIGISNLDIVCYLFFGAWDFINHRLNCYI